MAEDNVTSLGARLERWTVAFDDPASDFTVKVSSHGRIMFASVGSRHVLNMVAATGMLQGVVKELMLHGFGPSPTRPPDLDPVAFLKGR